MNTIKNKWFFISLIYVFVVYFIFIVYLKGSQPTFYYLLLSLYVVVTAILFLGNIVGFPGLILHAFFKKEELALPFYRASYKLGCRSSQILSAYGIILLRKGEAKEAKEIFEAALEKNRNYLYTHTLKANIIICEWKLGNTQKAYQDYLELYYFPDRERLQNYDLENLDAGKECNPSFSPQDFLTIGYLALINKEMDAALYFSTIALDKMPQYAAAYDNLGQIYYVQGEPEKAQEYFEKAIELKPTLIDSLYYLAKIHFEKGDAKKAEEYLENALKQPYNALNTISKAEMDELDIRLKSNLNKIN